jgi:GH24 family phage-related lysozyme (muramidase)
MTTPSDRVLDYFLNNYDKNGQIKGQTGRKTEDFIRAVRVRSSKELPKYQGDRDQIVFLWKDSKKSFVFEPRLHSVSASGKASLDTSIFISFPEEMSNKDDLIEFINNDQQQIDFINQTIATWKYFNDVNTYSIIQDPWDPDLIPPQETKSEQPPSSTVETVVIEPTTPNTETKIPNGKTLIFNVSNSNILANSDLGTFSIINANLEENPYSYLDEEIIDEEFTELSFGGLEQEVEIIEPGEAEIIPDVEADDLNLTSTSTNSDNNDTVSIDSIGTWSRKIKKLTTQKNWEADAANYISLKEGFVSEAKWDVNHYRMGYGSEKIKKNGKLLEVKKGDTCTKEQAVDTLASYGIPEYSKQIAKDLGQNNWNKLTGYQKAALTSLGYNVGAFFISSRSYGKRIKAAIESGDMKKAAEEILNGPRKAGGKLLSGLVQRRKEEAQLFLLPDSKSIY